MAGEWPKQTEHDLQQRDDEHHLRARIGKLLDPGHREERKAIDQRADRYSLDHQGVANNYPAVAFVRQSVPATLAFHAAEELERSRSGVFIHAGYGSVEIGNAHIFEAFDLTT